MKIEIGLAIAILGSTSGAYLWDADRRESGYNETHEQITADSSRRATEAELQRVQLEIKFLLEVSERRSLSVDEQDRLGYLRSLRVLLREQMG